MTLIAVLAGVLFAARTLLEQSLNGFGCLGCRCDVDGDSVADDEIALHTAVPVDERPMPRRSNRCGHAGSRRRKKTVE